MKIRNPYALAAKQRKSAGPMLNSASKRLSNNKNNDNNFYCYECGLEALFISLGHDDDEYCQPDTYWCFNHKKFDSKLISYNDQA